MKKNIVSMIAILLLSSGAGVVGLSVDNLSTVVAQAKTKKIKSFPKAYRHSWYQYDGHGGYNKVVIKTHTIQFVYPNTYVFPGKLQALKTKKTHGYTWVNTRDSDNSAGTSFFFRTTSKKWSGKKHKALIEVRGSAFSMQNTYYSSKTHHK